ncbi:MAG: hypothetical protein HYW24_03210 [Candidatus Aenigmarchaeota archaeon]|nr:hypothetical protein [Candidatus Aenigmarchaeota archaeon]
MRGAYALGAIDALYSHFGLKRVDYVTGSSSSIGTLSYYTAGQFYPGYYIWTRELPNHKFLSLRNIFTGHPFLNVDYLIDEVFKKHIPLNRNKVKTSKIRFIIPVTNSKTGEVKYFDNMTKYDFFEILRAAMSPPFAYGKTVKIGKDTYFDGRESDPLPIDFPGIKQSKKIIILTKTENELEQIDIAKHLSAIFKWKLERGVYKALQHRQTVYKKRLRQVKKLEVNGDIVIRPSRQMSVFDNRVETLKASINQGYQDTISHKKLSQLMKTLKADKKYKYYFK